MTMITVPLELTDFPSLDTDMFLKLQGFYLFKLDEFDFFSISVLENIFNFVVLIMFESTLI